MGSGGTLLLLFLLFFALSFPALGVRLRLGRAAITLPLRTDSRWVVDGGGRRVKLACVNWAAHMEPMLAEGLGKQPLDGISKRVAAMGFNCVRLTWALYMLTDASLAGLTATASLERLGLAESAAAVRVNNPHLADLTVVQAFQAVVANLASNGIMVILDNQISKPEWCCSRYDGNGFFGDEYFDPDEWVRGLTQMATLFNGTSNVVGMSLRNELRGPRQNVTEWYRYMLRGAEAVHSANPDVLVILSGLDYDKDLSFLAEKPAELSFAGKLVFELHWYGFSDGGDWESGNPNEVCGGVVRNVTRKGCFLLEQGWPLFLGEFGVDQGSLSPADGRFLSCFLSVAAELDLDWALWALQGSYYVREGMLAYDETYGILSWDWCKARNSYFLPRIAALQSPMQGPGLSDSSRYKIIFHPLTGQCITRNRHLQLDTLQLGPCAGSEAWSYDGGGRLVLEGALLCLQADGPGKPARLGVGCSNANSSWQLISDSKMHLSSVVATDGSWVCLEAAADGAVVTNPCKCLGREEAACDPQSQKGLESRSTQAEISVYYVLINTYTDPCSTRHKTMKPLLFFLLLLLCPNLYLLRVAKALPLSTNSRWIVDEAGARVKLACVNWVSHLETVLAEGLSKQPLDSISKKIAATGFNCVRFTWPLFLATNDSLASLTVRQSFQSLGLIESIAGIRVNNPTLLDLPLIQAFQAVVSNLGSNNLMVILDNHLSKPGWCCSNTDGNGFFGDQYFDPEEWINGLTRMATLFNGTGNVVGMSLRNELRGPRQNVSEWYRYMTRGAEAVHAANPDVLVILSGLSFDLDLTFLAQRQVSLTFTGKLVFEVHWYAFSDGQAWANGNQNQVCGSVAASVMRRAGYLLGRGWPLLLSEFGVDQRGVNVNDNRYLSCALAVAAELDVDWALWALQGSYYTRQGTLALDETYGLLDWSWCGLRSAAFLRRISPLQSPFQGPGLSDSPPYKILFHPATGLCLLRKSLVDPLLLGPCSETDAWNYTAQQSLVLRDSPLLCLRAEGPGSAAKLSLVCGGADARWAPYSDSKMHLASQLLSDGATALCLDVGPDGSTVVTNPCKCLRGDRTCQPDSQWFKLVSSSRPIAGKTSAVLGLPTSLGGDRWGLSTLAAAGSHPAS
ncbi:hypothetical protein Taro_034499 [Colocasia esculenta]|uniref:Glycoside hydrolase family 5 domain-containing protein n=1 Tax=Colocasia esculenta TaxID=4460 RepID=A0A843W112_COLES|nr:hypothetical protein [Colocasia esculenta]